MAYASAPTAAEAAFPPNDWQALLEELKPIQNNDQAVLNFIIDKGLAGIGSAVMQMDANQLPDLHPIRRRYQKANEQLTKSKPNVPLGNLGIGWQPVLCSSDLLMSVIPTSKGLTPNDVSQAKRRAREIVKGTAEIVIAALPRRRSTDKEIVSIHFTGVFIPDNDRTHPRFFDSYNLQKEEGTAPGYKELQQLWRDNGIADVTIRPPQTKFEKIWAPFPHNSRFAVPDIAVIGELPKDSDLIHTSVFGISAQKPGTNIYTDEANLSIHADYDTHLALECLHQLSKIAREKEFNVGQETLTGILIGFMLHIGSHACLNLFAAAMGQQEFATLPINETFAILSRKANKAWLADKPGLPLDAFLNDRATGFRQVSPEEANAFVQQGFETPSMTTPRDDTRSSYCTQYIRSVVPHPNPAFNEIGLIALRSGARLLERYAAHPDAAIKGDQDGPMIDDIFGRNH